MSVEDQLGSRCGQQCELCSGQEQLAVFAVDAGTEDDADRSVMICQSCRQQLSEPDTADVNHWRCLNESIWSQVPAVQVLSWRILDGLRSEGWPNDLLETVYLEDDVRQWAESAVVDDHEASASTLDSNGTTLAAGDTVTLIKDLVVKGGGFTAKRGTAVKNIALTSNPKHVEGRVNGTQIVLVAEFLKKAN